MRWQRELMLPFTALAGKRLWLPFLWRPDRCQIDRRSRQIDALKEAGCEKWFLDKMTGSKAERKGLDEALAYLRPGDMLVVWKLDRAGRSLTHLIELLKDLNV
jgi:DNA invertase Pin-like site-specific DNA recombinase